MPGPLNIQPCSYDHPDAVAMTRQVQDLYRTLYGGTDDSPINTEEFTPPHGLFLIGYLEEQPAAMGGWRFLPSGRSEAERPVELKRMFVVPGLRGHGYGLQMLRALEDSAAAAGADWVLLSTGEPQAEAVHLYQRSGYRHVEPFGFFACSAQAVHLGRPLGEGPPALPPTF